MIGLAKSIAQELVLVEFVPMLLLRASSLRYDCCFVRRSKNGMGEEIPLRRGGTPEDVLMLQHSWLLICLLMYLVR